MRRKAQLLLLLSLPGWAFGLLASGPAVAANQMTLRLDGVTGESTLAKGAKGAMDIQSFSWGVSNATTAVSSTGGMGVAKPVFKEIDVLKHVDSASPTLALFTAQGKSIPSGEIDVFNSSTGRPYFQYCLTSIHVSSDAVSGDSNGLTESVSLNYGAVYEGYRQTLPTGAPGNLFAGGWDLIHNVQYGSRTGCQLTI